MEFFINQTTEKINKYINDICNIARLCTPLMGDSEDVFLPYRAHEKVFSKNFAGLNVSRQDSSIDCVIRSDGYQIIGSDINIDPSINGAALKTFTKTINFNKPIISGKKNTFKSEKIAEFDTEFNKLDTKNLSDLEIAKFIAELRNKRLDETITQYNLNNMFYHYAVRSKERIYSYETPMAKIELDKIVISNKRKGSKNINFNDGINYYTFDIAKSTLKMRFLTENEKMVILVKNCLSENQLYKLIDNLDYVLEILSNKI